MSLAKELAQSILDTAKAREESYDHVAADLAAILLRKTTERKIMPSGTTS